MNDRLIELVMQRIEKRRLDHIRLAVFSYGVVVMGTLASIVPAYNYAAANANETGFSSYMSLLVSDSTHLAGSWTSLMMSLVESAPVQGTVVILGTLFVFTYSAKKMFTDIRLIRTSQLS